MTEVSRVLGLDDLMQRKPGQLSGGQRQRVAVGRALVRRSDVFLLDEPLSNLDALLREHVRADLKQIFLTQNAPVVYVTHDQTEAMTLSTQVAVLNNGYLQQLAAPERIYDRPANQFVAGFVGSPQMNLLTLPCQGNYALLGDFKIRLPDLPTVPPQIVLGVRPEHLHLAETEAAATLNGKVFLVENLGMHNLVSINVSNAQSAPIVLRALLPPEHWSNQTLSFTIPPDERHWFDVQTGDSLVRRS